MKLEDKIKQIDISEKCIEDGIATLQHDFKDIGKCCYITCDIPEYMYCAYREVSPMEKTGLYLCHYEDYANKKFD